MDGKCDVCGKNVMGEDGKSYAPINFIFKTIPSILETVTFGNEQVGVYDTDVLYQACIECWLKSLGVQPKVECND